MLKFFFHPTTRPMNIKLFMLYAFLFVSMNSFSSSCEYSDPNTKYIFGRTIDTVGDSISVEGSLRCSLRDNGLEYDFVGNFFDNFGFVHDAIAAETTQDVLTRIATIPYSDAYFLLIGTNDQYFTAHETVVNIIKIAQILRTKNDNSIIYISTLLPRKDSLNTRNQQVNNMLMLLQKEKRWFKNCYVLDAGANFYQAPNWQENLKDAVHLNEKGYSLYSRLIMESMTSLIK